MPGLNNLMGKPLKHYAQDAITRQRYIVVALEDENDNDDFCLVIDIDSLDSDMRSELISVVEGDECQSQPEIKNVLDKKYFYNYPKASILKVLTALHKIKSIKSAQVLVKLPYDKTMTPKEIKKGIREYNLSLTSSKNSLMSNNVDNNTNKEEIENIKSEMNGLKEQIENLTSSMADLIKALKQ